MNEPNFDRIARWYCFLEHLTLGRALQNCRTHYIPQLLDRSAALVLGDGDGRFLAALLAANLGLQATTVDSSSAMLHLLRTRCHADAARVHTLHQPVSTELPAETYDLITAHFLFDCMTQPELDALIPRLAAAHAHVRTLWLVSDFHIPQGMLRVPASLYVRGLYLAFRVLTGLRAPQLPDHQTPLQRAGLTRTHRHRSLGGLLVTEIWAPAGGDAAAPCGI